VPDPLECVRVTLPLDRDARVFVSASVDWGVYGGRYAGECRLTADGAPIPGGPVAHPGEYDLEDQGAAQPYPGDLDFGVFTGVDYLSQLSLSHVAGPFAPGDHDFGLLCGNKAGAMRFKNPSISAVAISPE
jgi:hypothetical protein